MQVTFKVYRKDPEKDGKPGRSNYPLDLPEDATVLEALLKIRDESDSTLAFRGSCGRGYCGECMMRVNGSTRLATSPSSRISFSIGTPSCGTRLKRSSRGWSLRVRP